MSLKSGEYPIHNHLNYHPRVTRSTLHNTISPFLYIEAKSREIRLRTLTAEVKEINRRWDSH